MMTSYFRGWLTSGLTTPSPATTAAATTNADTADVPTLTRESPPPDAEDEGSDTETERGRDDDDSPPAFPSLNSAQRVQQQPMAASNPLPKVLIDTQLMPPPPVPASRPSGVNRATPGSLAVPPTTTKRPTPAAKKREKVALAPGHSPMDWANLKSSGQDLRVSSDRPEHLFVILTDDHAADRVFTP